MSDPAADRPEDAPADEATRRAARRQLLRAAAYAVPALLGSFIVARRAEAQASCLPRCACSPGATLCGPDCCLPVNDCIPWFCSPIQNCGPF